MSAKAATPSASYILDKLQSLSGIVPIGLFLADHLFNNSYALVGVKQYDTVSAALQTIPWRVPVEFAVLWIPILFHGCYGLYIWWLGKSNSFQHPWMANWIYTLQRWTGIVAFAFIGWHLYSERYLSHGKSTYASVAQSMQIPYYVAFYIIGITASSFHLGTGIWNFCCKWGLAVTPRSQRAVGYIGAAIFVVLTIVGIATVAGFRYNWRPFEFYTQ
jgi:succinate dehydrogenase / fumarate reductase cytochrome b subunit